MPRNLPSWLAVQIYAEAGGIFCSPNNSIYKWERFKFTWIDTCREAHDVSDKERYCYGISAGGAPAGDRTTWFIEASETFSKNLCKPQHLA